MGDSPRSGRQSIVRSAVFFAIAAGLLVGLRLSWVAPGRTNDEARWGSLYLRAGDTFVRMLYLSELDPESAPGRRLLQTAMRYYLKSLKADPSDVKAVTSLGLVLHALRRDEEARFVLSSAALRPRPPGEAEALKATVMVIRATAPKPAHVASAHDLLAGVLPGPLTLAAAYEGMAEPQMADQERAAATVEARSIIPRLAALLVICGLLIAVGLIGLVLAFLTVVRRRAPTEEASWPDAWGPREAAEALILWISLTALVGAVATKLRPGRSDTAWDAVLLIGASLIGGVAAVVWVRAVSPTRAPLGWRPARPWRDLGLGLAAAGICAPIALLLAETIERVWGQSQPVEHPLVPVFATAGDWGGRLALVLAACAVIPVVEETLFRGILYRSLRRIWPLLPAAAASGLIFAVGHMSWVGILPYLLLGMVLAWLYERTGSLLAPAVAHGAFNGFNLAILVALFG